MVLVPYDSFMLKNNVSAVSYTTVDLGYFEVLFPIERA